VESSHQLVQKLWNYCNILRDDLSAYGHAQGGGLSYLLAHGLSASPAQAGAQASGDYPSAWFRTGSERLAHLAFLKMADGWFCGQFSRTANWGMIRP